MWVWDRSSNEVSLLVDSAVAGVPAWSPEGRRIAYIDARDAAVVVIDAISGEESTRLTVGSNPSEGRPSSLLTLGGPTWSPDGTRLAFSCWDGAGDEICIAELDGATRRQLTRLEPLPGAEDDGVDQAAASNTGPPSWSPDGSSLAVAVYPERRGAPSGVFVIDLARGNARRVSNLLPNSVIVWMPDSSAVVFSAPERGRSDIVRAPMRGAEVKLTESLEFGARNPTLSPDGSGIAAESGRAIVILGEEDIQTVEAEPGARNSDPTWNPAEGEIAFAVRQNPLRVFD